jgi:hypothetical protein
MDNWLETRAELLHGDLYFPNKNAPESRFARSSRAQLVKAPIAGV